MVLRIADILCKAALEMRNETEDGLIDVMNLRSTDLVVFRGAMQQARDFQCLSTARIETDDCDDQIYEMHLGKALVEAYKAKQNITCKMLNRCYKSKCSLGLKRNDMMFRPENVKWDGQVVTEAANAKYVFVNVYSLGQAEVIWSVRAIAL